MDFCFTYLVLYYPKIISESDFFFKHKQTKNFNFFFFQFFAIIVFGCISSSGWYFLQPTNLLEGLQGKEVCVMNMDSTACHFSTLVGIVAFLASIGFLVGEWFFEQMSSIKTRKHYVIFDMAFSGLWAFFYFVTFIYMCIAWSKTDDVKFDFASSNIYGAIFFAFLSIFGWVSFVQVIIFLKVRYFLKKSSTHIFVFFLIF